MSSMPPSFFNSSDIEPFDDELIRAYLATGKSVDNLAYTVEFDDIIYKTLQDLGDKRTKADVFRRLLNLRKTGRLPRVA